MLAYYLAPVAIVALLSNLVIFFMRNDMESDIILIGKKLGFFEICNIVGIAETGLLALIGLHLMILLHLGVRDIQAAELVSSWAFVYDCLWMAVIVSARLLTTSTSPFLADFMAALALIGSWDYFHGPLLRNPLGHIQTLCIGIVCEIYNCIFNRIWSIIAANYRIFDIVTQDVIGRAVRPPDYAAAAAAANNGAIIHFKLPHTSLC